MTEQQIHDGYEQLDSALAPPLDAQDRVTQRVHQRRQRRRVGVAGLATLAVVGAGAAAVSLSGGDDRTDDVIASEPPSGSSLVLTRPDGSTYTFADVTVTCASPAGDDVPAGERIYLTSPRDLRGDTLLTPLVYIEGIVDKLQGDRTFTLPVDGPGGSDTYPLTLFVADTEGGPGGNEVSSASGGSGTVRVLRAECEPTPVLELEVDATLGSEEGLQSLDLAGAVR